MKAHYRIAVAAVVVAAGLWTAAPPAAAAEDEGIERVIEQARFWEARGRYGRAADAWQKVLASDPDNPEALAALGINAANAGREDEARAYLSRLEAAAPDHPGTAELREALSMTGLDQGALQRARAAAEAERYEDAVNAYRAYFSGREPNGRVGLEYYQSLAATEGGWPEARAGLQRLANEHPDDPVYELVLARQLTYRADTRREGIRRLAGLEDEEAVAESAGAARRQALLWLDAKPGDIPLYRAYMRAHPDDTEVASRLDSLQQAAETASEEPRLSKTDALVRDGFAALDRARLEEAETAFRNALTESPGNASALGGLGLIELRRERFGEAEDLLRQATQAAPGSAGRWRDALATASFWSGVRRADAARDAGEMDRALDLYRAALEKRPGEHAVRLSYADTLARAGRYGEAEKQFRQVLAKDKDNSDAQRGLIGALQAQGDTDAAIAYIDSLPEDVRQSIGGVAALRAERLRKEAADVREAGDRQQAESLLLEAMSLDPANPWVRLDLATLYQSLGRDHEANSLVDGLLRSGDAVPQALYVKALIKARQEAWGDALGLMERIPESARTADMRQLQNRLWAHYQVERALSYYRNGRGQQARELLAEARAAADDNPELLGAVARAYAEIGDSEAGLDLMRQLLARSTEPDPDLRLEYARLLLELGQTVEYRAQLQRLRQEEEMMTPAQRERFADLQALYAVREADRLREEGYFADAFETLQPHLNRSPRDPALNGALARLYADFGEPEAALSIYYDILDEHPNDRGALLGAARAARDAGRYQEAEDLVDEAMRVYPDDPEVYVIAGRLARDRGQSQRAVDMFRQAMELEAATAQGREEAYTAGEGGTRNPFGEPQLRRSGSGGVRRDSFRPEPEPRVGRGLSGADAMRLAARPAPASRPAPAQYYPEDNEEAYEPPVRRYPAADRDRSPERTYPRTERAPRRPDTSGLRRMVTEAENDVAREIREIEAENSSWVAGGMALRQRDGEDGLGELTEVNVPVEASFSALDTGRLRLRAVPVTLNSGDLNPGVATGFGALPLAEAVNGEGSAEAIVQGGGYDQSDSGIAVGVVYEVGDWALDIGTSPLGFTRENAVGGVRWRPQWDNVYLDLRAGRRAVTESLLSYAGTTQKGVALDDGNQIGEFDFGGVTRNGVRGDITLDQGDAGLYGNFGLYYLEGEYVADNTQIEFGGGYYRHVVDRENNRFTIGLNLSAFFYDENLGEFTVGHGGYFSPQFYALLGVPMNWTGRNDRMTYSLGGSIGLQSFERDAADIFPENFGGLQTRLAAAGGLDGRTSYSGDDETGLGFNVKGEMEYLITPQISLGAGGGFDNAKDYNEFSVMAYLRYWFKPQVPDSLGSPRMLAPFFTGGGDPAW